MNAACISRHDCEAVLSVQGPFKTYQGHLQFMASEFNSAIQGHTSSTLADTRSSANAAWIHGELVCLFWHEFESIMPYGEISWIRVGHTLSIFELYLSYVIPCYTWITWLWRLPRAQGGTEPHSVMAVQPEDMLSQLPFAWTLHIRTLTLSEGVRWRQYASVSRDIVLSNI